jgi:hypothetical protein
MVGLLVMFNHRMRSPNASLPVESTADSFRWIMGLSVIGVLLMFLGLVRRQPIPESGEEALPFMGQ